jgi:menaquinone-dependent protoporphyrinogen oxidase
MSRKPISRRNFLKISAGILGASTLACFGLGYAASRSSQTSPSQTVQTPNFYFGKVDPMNKRLLVAYATFAGSTVDVAAAIGESLGNRGFAVDVKPLKDDPDPGGYPYVILGSAIHGANWLPEAVQYVQNHQAALKQIPVGLFCVHIMNLGEDEKSRQNRLAYLKTVRSLVNCQAEAYFAGRADMTNQSSFATWIYRFFKIGPEGDCRDWNKIRGWAESLNFSSN